MACAAVASAQPWRARLALARGWLRRPPCAPPTPSHSASFQQQPFIPSSRRHYPPLLGSLGVLALLCGLVVYSATAVPAGRATHRLVDAVDGASRGLGRVVTGYVATVAVTLVAAVATLALGAAALAARARLAAHVDAGLATPRGDLPDRAAFRAVDRVSCASIGATCALAAWCVLLLGAHVSASLAMESAVRGSEHALNTLGAAAAAANATLAAARDVGGGVLDGVLSGAQPQDAPPPLPPDVAPDAVAPPPSADLLARLQPAAGALGAAARRALGPDPAATGAADGAADAAALQSVAGALRGLGLIGGQDGATASSPPPPPTRRRALRQAAASAPAPSTRAGTDLLAALASSLQPSRQDVLNVAARASRAVDAARRAAGAPATGPDTGSVCPSIACLDVRVFPGLASDACVCSAADLETVRSLATTARAFLRVSLVGVAAMYGGASLLAVRLATDRSTAAAHGALLFGRELDGLAARGRERRDRRRTRASTSPGASRPASYVGGPGSRAASGTGGRPPLPPAWPV